MFYSSIHVCLVFHSLRSVIYLMYLELNDWRGCFLVFIIISRLVFRISYFSLDWGPFILTALYWYQDLW